MRIEIPFLLGEVCHRVTERSPALASAARRLYASTPVALAGSSANQLSPMPTAQYNQPEAGPERPVLGVVTLVSKPASR
jgi:hypothetical protein